MIRTGSEIPSQPTIVFKVNKPELPFPSSYTLIRQYYYSE